MRWGFDALVLAIALAACQSASTQTAPSAPPAAAPPVRARSPANVSDDRNIARGDYIGPEACGECHPAQQALWSASMHRVMNARATDPGAVIGQSAVGTPIPYKGGELRMDRDDRGYTLTAQRGSSRVRYRVTRTIGHLALQEYVGVEEGNSDAVEVRLPIGFWPRTHGYAVQPQFDPWLDEATFDPYVPVREPWAARCPWCHSTYAFAQRIARSSGPHPVGHGLEQYFTSDQGSETLDVDGQVTTGISCESCHLGGRAHAEGAPISFVPRGATARPDAPAFPTTFAAQRVDAGVVNTVCAQCHSGPSPRLPDGTALRNSSEALDLAASSCTGIKCTDCHDPHVANPAPDEAKAVAVCVSCHATQAVPQHAGAGHENASCLDCHMPRVVMGIDHYVRTHRISSPTNPALIAAASPNACNLCHLDRPIRWTLDELRRGWEVKLAPKLAAYGEDDASVGDVWLASKSPAIRLVAAHAYARSPLGTYAKAQIAKGLADPLAYVRAWSQLALDQIQAPIKTNK